jgi:hypothetical protein
MRAIAVVVCSMWLAACGGGSAGGADAAPADAAAADASAPDAPEYGVRCGPAMTLCVPGATQGCCDDADAGPPACSPMNGLCLGKLTSCDGAEDCPNAGDVCCDFGFGPGCIEPASCDPAGGGTRVCHVDADCPASAAHCCQSRCGAAACQ